jgi:hypothetical protein
MHCAAPRPDTSAGGWLISLRALLRWHGCAAEGQQQISTWGLLHF